jgi:hypothetical protein
VLSISELYGQARQVSERGNENHGSHVPEIDRKRDAHKGDHHRPHARTLEWMATHKRPLRLRVNQFAKLAIVTESARPYLERMGLEAPRTLKQRVLQRALVYALASIDAI